MFGYGKTSMRNMFGYQNIRLSKCILGISITAKLSVFFFVSGIDFDENGAKIYRITERTSKAWLRLVNVGEQQMKNALIDTDRVHCQLNVNIQVQLLTLTNG
jgi:hypothetical protein